MKMSTVYSFHLYHQAPTNNTEERIDAILVEWWKLGERWQYTTLSAINETECDNLKENLNEIQNYFKQKYSNPLIMKTVEILINGRERYQKDEVCTILDDPLQANILLVQGMEINFGFKQYQPLRKNFTSSLVGALEQNSTYDLPSLLCLTKLWAKQTIEKTSKFFRTQHRIKKWFELNIDPIVKLFESSGHKSAPNCEFSPKKEHAQPLKHKSIELPLINALNFLISKIGPSRLPS